MSLPNKLVAVVNKNLDPGVAMNSLAHMSLGIGASIGAQDLQLVDYVTKDEEVFPEISKMPYIVLRATSGKIQNLITLAHQKGIKWSAFTDTVNYPSLKGGA